MFCLASHIAFLINLFILFYYFSKIKVLGGKFPSLLVSVSFRVENICTQSSSHQYYLCFFSGGFMLIRLSDGTSELIDFRETAPAAANKSMFIEYPELSQTGGLAVGVP